MHPVQCHAENAAGTCNYAILILTIVVIVMAVVVVVVPKTAKILHKPLQILAKIHPPQLHKPTN